MNHKQLLGYLPRDLVEPVLHDVARVTAWEMLGPEKVPHAVLTERVLAPIFLRWNCVLNAPSEEASDQYKDLTRLTLVA